MCPPQNPGLGVVFGAHTPVRPYRQDNIDVST